MQLDSLAVFCYLSFFFFHLSERLPRMCLAGLMGHLGFLCFISFFNRIFHSVSNLSSKKVEDSKLCFASLFIK